MNAAAAVSVAVSAAVLIVVAASKEIKMKISKRQLRRIIKEEKSKLHEQSRQAKEATLMADLNSITTSIEDIASGMYGLEDPADPSMGAGDEMAQELEMQAERLTDFYNKMVAHFESMDPEFDAGAPGMR